MPVALNQKYHKIIEIQLPIVLLTRSSYNLFRYHFYSLEFERSSYHKNQILKSQWEWQPSLPHSCPPENCHLCTKSEIFYTILHTTVASLLPKQFKDQSYDQSSCPLRRSILLWLPNQFDRVQKFCSYAANIQRSPITHL